MENKNSISVGKFSTIDLKENPRQWINSLISDMVLLYFAYLNFLEWSSDHDIFPYVGMGGRRGKGAPR